MSIVKENDCVWTAFGYGVLVKLGKKSKLKENILCFKLLNLHKFLAQIEIKPIKNTGAQEAIKQPEVQPQQKKEEPAQGTEPNSSNEPKENNPNQELIIQEKKPNEDYNIVAVKLKSGGTVYLDINIKTFFGERKTYTVDVDLGTTIQQIKNIVVEMSKENAKSLFNLRLIYPMGFINELSVSGNTLEMYKIPDNANLILLVQTTFFWDPNMKGSGIKLLSNNLVANKNGDSDYQTVLGNLPMSSGRHYWEIKVDKYVDEEDIFIGICRKNLDLYAQPTTTNLFWGYMCLCAKRFGSDGGIYDYGYVAKQGDVIGVLLEFRSGVGSLSFYKNGAKCGVAFSNLQGSFYPAVCMFYGEVQVTLDPKAQMPLN